MTDFTTHTVQGFRNDPALRTRTEDEYSIYGKEREQETIRAWNKRKARNMTNTIIRLLAAFVAAMVLGLATSKALQIYKQYHPAQDPIPRYEAGVCAKAWADYRKATPTCELPPPARADIY